MVKQSLPKRVGIAVLGWGAAFVLFFPLLWMLLTSSRASRRR